MGERREGGRRRRHAGRDERHGRGRRQATQRAQGVDRCEAHGHGRAVLWISPAGRRLVDQGRVAVGLRRALGRDPKHALEATHGADGRWWASVRARLCFSCFGRNGTPHRRTKCSMFMDVGWAARLGPSFRSFYQNFALAWSYLKFFKP